MGGSVAYRFRCPGCRESFEVNAAMRRALIQTGCVLCGAGVSSSAFSPE